MDQLDKFLLEAGIIFGGSLLFYAHIVDKHEREEQVFKQRAAQDYNLVSKAADTNNNGTTEPVEWGKVYSDLGYPFDFYGSNPHKDLSVNALEKWLKSSTK